MLTFRERQLLDTWDLQHLHECNGKFIVGVNYCAMDKYREPCSPEQWKNCVESIRVRRL